MYKNENGEIYGIENEEQNIVILYAESGEAVTLLGENVYPVDSDVSARYLHPEGIVLERKDADLLGIEIKSK